MDKDMDLDEGLKVDIEEGIMGDMGGHQNINLEVDQEDMMEGLEVKAKVVLEVIEKMDLEVIVKVDQGMVLEGGLTRNMNQTARVDQIMDMEMAISLKQTVHKDLDTNVRRGLLVVGVDLLVVDLLVADLLMADLLVAVWVDPWNHL